MPVPAPNRFSKKESQFPFAFRFVAVLGFAYILSQFLRASNAVVAPELTRDLTLDPGDIGILTGAFFMAFALVQIPIGILFDRLGPRRVVSALLLLAVAGCLLFAVSGDLVGLTLARALMGVGCAGTLMGAYVIYARWYPLDRFALFSGFQLGIGNSGLLIATLPLSAAIVAFGWRTSFVITGLVGLAMALLVFLFIKDQPGETPGPARQESFGEGLKGVGLILGDRRLWRLFPLNFVGYSSVATITTLWAGPYLADVQGLEALGRGRVLLLMSLFSMVGAFSFGPLDRLLNTRKWIVVAGASMTVADLALLAVLDQPALAVVVTAFSLLALMAGYMTVLLAHARSYYPRELIGRGMTVANTINMSGVAFSQFITGAIVDAYTLPGLAAPAVAYHIVFGFLAALLFMALMIYFSARDQKPREPEKA